MEGHLQKYFKLPYLEAWSSHWCIMDALKGEQKGRRPEDLAHGGLGQNNCDHKL